jgi:hypothetical protein
MLPDLKSVCTELAANTIIVTMEFHTLHNQKTPRHAERIVSKTVCNPIRVTTYLSNLIFTLTYHMPDNHHTAHPYDVTEAARTIIREYDIFRLYGRKWVAISGSRIGVSPQQEETLARMLTVLQPKMLLHGGQTGADSVAHRLATCGVVGHPYVTVHPGPKGPTFNATDRVTILPRAPFLERNNTMVRESIMLIAMPLLDIASDRGGTWYTIRRAIKKGLAVLIIMQDGQLAWPDTVDDLNSITPIKD